MNRLMKCPFCMGSGFIEAQNFFSYKLERKKCTDCEGSGKIEVGRCQKKKK